MPCRDGFCGGCERCAPQDDWQDDYRQQEEERYQMEAQEHLENADFVQKILERHGAVYLLDMMADACERLDVVNPGDGWYQAMELVDETAQTIAQLDDREYESDTKVLGG